MLLTVSGAFVVHRSTVVNELLDIPLIGQFNDISNTTVSVKFLISKIKKESQLTESTIKNSAYFPEIAQRYQRYDKNGKLYLEDNV